MKLGPHVFLPEAWLITRLYRHCFDKVVSSPLLAYMFLGVVPPWLSHSAMGSPSWVGVCAPIQSKEATKNQNPSSPHKNMNPPRIFVILIDFVSWLCHRGILPHHLHTFGFAQFSPLCFIHFLWGHMRHSSHGGASSGLCHYGQ